MIMIKISPSVKFPTLSELKKKSPVVENQFAKIFILDLGGIRLIKVVDKSKDEQAPNDIRNTYSLTNAGYSLARHHFEAITSKSKK